MIPMLMMFGAQAASGLLSGLAQRKEAAEQAVAVNRANLANTREAAQEVASIQVQRGFVRQQTTRDLELANRMALTAGGDVRANAAAAGVKGASVDAVANDIEMELGRAIGEIQIQAEGQEYNLLQSIRQTLAHNRLNLGVPPKIPSVGSVLTNAVVGAAFSSANAYAGQYFKFGAGPTKTKQ